MKTLFFILMLLPGLVQAQIPSPEQTIVRDGVTLTQTQEQHAEAIGDQLRCLVCQNESIEGSSATLAKQLRIIIRQHVAAGDDEKSIMAYMVHRYGIFVLLKPPFSRLTLLLYATPVAALLIGFLVAWLARRGKTSPPPPLDYAEQTRLERLLKS